MKLIVITGNEAVGKMTVAQELSKQTGFRLFHSHMAMEPVREVFGRFHKPAIRKYREIIFDEFSKDKNQKGLIFTMKLDYKNKEQIEELLYYISICRKNNENLEVYLVNLKAPFSVRFARNITSNRLKYKPSKRNFAQSEKELRKTKGKYTVNQKILENIVYTITDKGRFIQFDNSKFSPELAASFIKSFFSF